MPRRATGEVIEYERADGGTDFYARFRAYGRRRRVKLGSDLEGWNRQRARNAVDEIMDQVARGVWRSRDASRPARLDERTFHEGASRWLGRKKRALSRKTYDDYEWRLRGHLLPYFKDYRTGEIDVEAVEDYRAFKLAERDDRREAGLKALSNDSINATISILAQILDELAELGYQVQVPNPASSRRRRLRSERARRTFLEPDQAAAMLEAAALLDAAVPMTWEAVCEIRGSRESNMALGARYGVSDSLVSRIRKGLVWRSAVAELRRRPAVATLLLAGTRIAELCALNVGDVDLPNRRLLIEDAKTETGRRSVVLSDLLAQELAGHLDRLGPRGPKAPLFVNTRGERYTPSGIRRAIIAPVARRARELVPSVPARVTPHTLRRTYISLLLAAGLDEGGADIPWVMAQVGHSDSKVTLEIYAQVVQSRRRDYASKVDRMIGGAASIGTRNGTRDDAASDSTFTEKVGRMAESQ